MIHQLLAGVYAPGYGSTVVGEANFTRKEDLYARRRRKIRLRRHECACEAGLADAT